VTALQCQHPRITNTVSTILASLGLGQHDDDDDDDDEYGRIRKFQKVHEMKNKIKINQ